MLLDVSKIRGSREHLSRTYAPEALNQPDEAYQVTEPVTLTLDIHKDEDRYRLVGRIRTVLTLACGRCLEPLHLPVDEAVDVLYVPATRNTGEGEIEVEEDDLATAYYREDTIDLGGLIREQFYLALPMKPLCRDDCRGLCPSCGANLNTNPCACEVRWEDPRLAELKALLPEDR